MWSYFSSSHNEQSTEYMCNETDNAMPKLSYGNEMTSILRDTIP